MVGKRQKTGPVTDDDMAATYELQSSSEDKRMLSELFSFSI